MIREFPRTTVGGLSLPRILIGTNWLLGWSHTGAAADHGIKGKLRKPFCTPTATSMMWKPVSRSSTAWDS